MKYYISMVLVGFVLMLSSSLVNAEIGRCCIAGTYVGEHSDGRSASCPDPKTEKFTMVINQTACGTTITGQVTDTRGDVTNMVGDVGKGCVITGRVSDAPTSPRGAPPRITPASEVTDFKGTMEKSPVTRKWQVTDGTYKSSSGCKGTFRMGQK